jgi:mono/diheme cytochrome c family protein
VRNYAKILPSLDRRFEASKRRRKSTKVGPEQWYRICFFVFLKEVNMQKGLILAIMILALVGLVVIAGSSQSAQANDNPGKAAFLSNKCNICHSVEAEKIEMTSGGYQKSKEKNVPPDLSGIGKQQNAEWFAKYLKHQEAVNGLKHAKTWRGTDEELQALSKWLEGLK